MKKNMNDTIPEFKTLEEEREYWESRSGLAEGHRARIVRPKTTLSSFLVVRLNGEEITKLRDIAAKKGLGTSTFARKVLTELIERESKAQDVTLDDVKHAAEDFISNYAALKRNSRDDVLVARDRERDKGK